MSPPACNGPGMILVFTRSRSLGSALIRVATWSQWSHVAILSTPRAVIDATLRHGVAERPLSALLDESTESRMVALPAPGDAAVTAARSQIGKPYDTTAITGLALRRDWQEADSWFCSELVAWAAQAAGAPLFRAESLYRVTPQHLWMLPGVTYGC